MAILIILSTFTLVSCGNKKGDKGDKGDQGVTGSQGAQGPAGADGEDGAKGDKGDTGADGADGTNGTNGTNGADGQDAFDPQIFAGLLQVAQNNSWSGTYGAAYNTLLQYYDIVKSDKVMQGEGYIIIRKYPDGTLRQSVDALNWSQKSFRNQFFRF